MNSICCYSRIFELNLNQRAILENSVKVSKILKMIVIFQKYQILQGLLGLDPHGGRMKISWQIAFSVLLITSVLLPFMFFVLTVRDDIHLALFTLPPIFGNGSVPLIYFHLFMNRERIYSLLGEFQAIVNESM